MGNCQTCEKINSVQEKASSIPVDPKINLIYKEKYMRILRINFDREEYHPIAEFSKNYFTP